MPEIFNSSSKLEGVAQSARGVCQIIKTRLNTTHSTAASGTSPNLGEVLRKSTYITCSFIIFLR